MMRGSPNTKMSRRSSSRVQVTFAWLELGNAVEARCQGSTKYYPARILGKSFDAMDDSVTFDVRFDDGDRDRKGATQ